MSSQEAEPRRGLSRRTVLLAAAGLAAVGAGVPITLALTQPPDRVAALTTRRRFVVAHRGGDDDWPEMSLLAYRSALALGVDAVEVSLARTSDGVWFGLHDESLDRTSGVHGFVAAKHTWAQVSEHRISARTSRDPGTAPQPYARLEDIVSAIGGRAAIFVDPKYARSHADELLDLLGRLVDHPQRLVVAKGQIGLQEPWAARALARGYRTWGFTYADSIRADPDLLTRALPTWSWLGLDVDGGAAEWAKVRALGRVVIAHQVATLDQARAAVDLGARGLMVSDVRAVLAPGGGSSPTP